MHKSAALFLLFPALLAGQMEMLTEVAIAPGQGRPASVVRSERYLFQNGVLRVESRDAFLLYRLKENRVYAGDSIRREFGDGTPDELQAVIQKAMPASATMPVTFGITAAKEAAAPQPITWQGQTATGEACKVTIEMPAGESRPPLILEQTVRVFTTELKDQLAAMQSARESIGMNSYDKPMNGSMPNAERVSAAMAACFPKDRMPVRVEIQTEGKNMPLPMSMTMTFAVTKLTTQTAPFDPKLFELPDTTGWKRVDLGAAWALYAGVKRVSGAESLPAQNKPTSKAEMVKKAEELKRLIEAEKWEEAWSVESSISTDLFRLTEAAKPSLSKQLEMLEAKIASTNRNDLDGNRLIEEAAALALKAGALEKAAKYARMLIAPTDGSFRNEFLAHEHRHDGHTVLGLLAWHAGDKEAAFSHLVEAGKAVRGAVRMYAFGARMELASKLLEDREYARVAQYIEACLQGKMQAEDVEIYERALGALRAGTKPYLKQRYDPYTIPPGAGR